MRNEDRAAQAAKKIIKSRFSEATQAAEVAFRQIHPDEKMTFFSTLAAEASMVV